MEKKFMVIPPNQTAAKTENTKQKSRVAAYCRVSTEQEEQLGSFANQIAYYTDYINGRKDYQLVEIFADEGISGTGIRKRTGFRRMITACEEGKVDLIITKSISRFARNTRDCLHYTRHLKTLGIPVIFEKEGINTMEASGELLFTILSSLAQEESRNISENTRWGIRSRFQQGIPHINTVSFLGYDKDENGQLVINEKQAEVVRRVFENFLEGWQPSEIARSFNEEMVPGVHGEARWVAASIVRMLQNEKYKGDIHMQKYYIRDFLTKELCKNNGNLESYYVENNHPPIVERETWEAAQLELKRLEEFKQKHGIRELGSCTKEPLYGKIFCCHCGGRFVKKSGQRFWKCINTTKEKGKICQNQFIDERVLERAFDQAWKVFADGREEFWPEWEKTLLAGNALEHMRARQMLQLTKSNFHWQEVSKWKRMLIREIYVENSGKLQVIFMDGTCFTCLDEYSLMGYNK